MRTLVFLTALACLACAPLSEGKLNSNGNQKALLTSVRTLTLHAGKKTAGRRSATVPQLNCVGGSARSEPQPSTVQCYNRGDDGFGGMCAGICVFSQLEAFVERNRIRKCLIAALGPLM